MVYTGAVVKVKIPARATASTYPGNMDETHYIRFMRSVRGGCVNFFLHTTDLELRGKNIIALASVFKKTLADMREYLYVDMTPLPGSTAVTHQLLVLSAGDRLWTEGKHLTFETPGPLEGLIIFTPRDFVAGRAG